MEASWSACDRTAHILLETHFLLFIQTCKWYHGIITHHHCLAHHSSVLLWAWRSGVTNYWKIIGHCGPRRLDFTPILSPSVWVLTWRCSDAYDDHIKGQGLLAQPTLADSEWQFTTKQLYSIMFQSNLRPECFMSALSRLCVLISQSRVSKVREAHLGILQDANKRYKSATIKIFASEKWGVKKVMRTEVMKSQTAGQLLFVEILKLHVLARAEMCGAFCNFLPKTNCNNYDIWFF
mgnify:CR=1 FL=1